MFKTISEVKAANKAAGHHWFDKGAMRFFNSKVHGGLYGGRYFITSERYDESHPRQYSVREVRPDGSVDTIGEFQRFNHLEDARDEVRKLSKHTVTRGRR